MHRHVTVVGAGIVGMACALYLQRQGHHVRVFEAVGPGEGCSKGNAGAISPDACSPMSSPAVLWSLPRWIFQEAGPVSIPLSYLPRTITWLARFVAAGHRTRVESHSQALRNLIRFAHPAYE